MLDAYGLSDVGPVRKVNEDSFIADQELCLFVVADGMGGHSAGEIASGLAVETIEGFVRRSEESSDLSWPYGIDSQLTFSGNRLKTAICLANRRVFRAAEKHDEYTGMGTTVAGVLVSPGHLVVGHAGDSRVYLLGADGLRRLTADDTWAATVLTGNGSPSGLAAAARHPMRHVLTNVLGARDHVDIHMMELPLSGGETILLCSDGLHSVMDDEAIARLLESDGSPATVVPRLIDAALAGGSRDNVTAVVIRYDGNGA